jgi:mono/diheme cytochrome c family protein
MKTRSIIGILGGAAIVLAAACSKPSSSDDKSTTNAGGGAQLDSVQAKDVFNSRCAACHGPNGDGNGPASAALNPKPRNYHDKEWQKKVTDEDIRKTITYGGAAVGKSPVMPASPDLDSKPEVVEGLLQIVRGFGKS